MSIYTLCKSNTVFIPTDLHAATASAGVLHEDYSHQSVHLQSLSIYQSKSLHALHFGKPWNSNADINFCNRPCTHHHTKLHCIP